MVEEDRQLRGAHDDRRLRRQRAESPPIAELIERCLPGSQIAHVHLNDPEPPRPGPGELRFGADPRGAERHRYAGAARSSRSSTSPTARPAPPVRSAMSGPARGNNGLALHPGCPAPRACSGQSNRCRAPGQHSQCRGLAPGAGAGSRPLPAARHRSPLPRRCSVRKSEFYGLQHEGIRCAAVPRALVADILRRIDRLRLRSLPP